MIWVWFCKARAYYATSAVGAYRSHVGECSWTAHTDNMGLGLRG